MVFKKRVIRAAVSLAATFIAAGTVLSANAAYVPDGVELASVQELVRGNGTEPATLDPQKNEGKPESNIMQDLFEGLVTQDGDGNIIPGQAESWTVSSDNRTFTFTLRESAKWSNGEPVTAADFVYAWQRAVDPATASQYAWYLESASIDNAKDIVAGEMPASKLGVKAIDDKTLQVHLDKPLPYFIKMLAHTTMYPVHRGTLEKYGDSWTKPGNMVSNGAYMLDRWVVNERIVLKRNPNYWNNVETVINKVTFLPIQSQTSDMNRFKAGEVDMTYEIPLEHFKSLKKQLADQVKVTGQLGTYYYVFNTEHKPFNDVNVRKALSYGINREAVANYIKGQGELPAYSFTPAIVNGFTPPDLPYSHMTQKERDEKAKELLEKAGYDRNNPLNLTLLYNTSESHKKIAVAIASMWKKLGVHVTMENQEWKSYLEAKNQGHFEVARAGWIGDYNEASTMLDLLTTGHGSNDGKYSNAKYDELIHQSRLASSDEERNQLYEQAEVILAKDMPVAPVYQYVTSRLVKPYIGGYPEANPEDRVYTRDLFIIKH